MRYAKIWMRIGGGLIDTIIVFFISLLVIVILGFLLGYKGVDVGITEEKITNIWNLRAFLVIISVDFLYTVITQAGNKQATYGQRALDLIIVKDDGTRASILQIVSRYFISIFSSIFFKLGYVIAVFTKRKQTVHDLLASTVVIERDERFLVNATRLSEKDLNKNIINKVEIYTFKDYILTICAVAVILFGVYVLII